MNSEEKKIASYYSLSPTKYGTLRRLTLSQAGGPDCVFEQHVSVVLACDTDSGGNCLRIDFTGVRNLVIRQPDWSLIVIAHIEILVGRDIPNVFSKFLVRDPDQERVLWFECADFHAAVEPGRDENYEVPKKGQY